MSQKFSLPPVAASPVVSARHPRDTRPGAKAPGLLQTLCSRRPERKSNQLRKFCASAYNSSLLRARKHSQRSRGFACRPGGSRAIYSGLLVFTLCQYHGALCCFHRIYEATLQRRTSHAAPSLYSVRMATKPAVSTAGPLGHADRRAAAGLLAPESTSLGRRSTTPGDGHFGL